MDSGNGVEPVRAPESVSQTTAVEPAKELHAPPVGAQVADEVMRGWWCRPSSARAVP